jgi:hypothetical protein
LRVVVGAVVILGGGGGSDPSQNPAKIGGDAAAPQNVNSGGMIDFSKLVIKKI